MNVLDRGGMVLFAWGGQETEGGEGRGEERGRSEGELGGVWTESDQNCGQNQLMRQRSVSRSLYTAFSEPVLSAVFCLFFAVAGCGFVVGVGFLLLLCVCFRGRGEAYIQRSAVRF